MVEFLISDQDQQEIGAGLGIVGTCYGHLFNNQQIRIEIALVNASEIQLLNSVHRQIDEPTDVLSFPLYANLSKIPAEIPILLGSIVICPEKALQYDESLVEMVHHGILHLIGEDHETDRTAWDIKEKEALTHLQDSGLRINAAPR